MMKRTFILLILSVIFTKMLFSFDNQTTVSSEAYIYKELDVSIEGEIGWGLISLAAANNNPSETTSLYVIYDNTGDVTVEYENETATIRTIPVGKGVSAPCGSSSWALSLTSDEPEGIGTNKKTFLLTGTIDSMDSIAIGANVTAGTGLYITYN